RRRPAGDGLADWELEAVHGVPPEVAECTRGPAAAGIDAPVLIIRVGQPVLPVAGSDRQQRARLSPADARTGLAHHRMVAVDEGDGSAEPELLGSLEHAAGRGRTGPPRPPAGACGPALEGAPQLLRM